MCLLVLFLPWLGRWVSSPALEALDTLLGWQCHRLEERTLVIAGVPMAVCSRCAGIYAGVALGAALAWPRWPVRRTVVVTLSALGLLLLEAGLEAMGWIPGLHSLRSVTGIALGWPVAAAAASLFSRVRPRSCSCS